MKTIQIPAPAGTLKFEKSCVDFGDALDICFRAAGTFVPDSNGMQFKPPLVQMDVQQWDLKGPFYAPDQKLDVTWTFTPSSGGPAERGTIEVKQDANCRQSEQPVCGPSVVTSGPTTLAKTIQIPGSRQRRPHEDEVGYDCNVDLHFTAEGVFWRSKGGNSFTPPMFQGYTTANSDHSCTSPHKDVTVDWRYIDEDGKETDGKIYVKKDASHSDTKTPGSRAKK